MRLRGTARSLDPAVRDHVEQRLHQVATGIAAAMGGSARVDYQRGYPVTMNDEQATEWAAEVARGKVLYRQRFSRGIPQGPLETVGAVANRRGTRVTFHPDAQIFGELARFEPARLFRMARSKAYLFGGVEIRWRSEIDDGETPVEATFHFPGGLADYLADQLNGSTTYADRPFSGLVEFRERFKAGEKWPDVMAEAFAVAREAIHAGKPLLVEKAFTVTLAGTVGLLRFPDPLSRLHALTKADNLGLGLIVLAIAWSAVWFYATNRAEREIDAWIGREATLAPLNLQPGQQLRRIAARRPGRQADDAEGEGQAEHGAGEIKEVHRTCRGPSRTRASPHTVNQQG